MFSYICVSKCFVFALIDLPSCFSFDILLLLFSPRHEREGESEREREREREGGGRGGGGERERFIIIN